MLAANSFGLSRHPRLKNRVTVGLQDTCHEFAQTSMIFDQKNRLVAARSTGPVGHYCWRSFRLWDFGQVDTKGRTLAWLALGINVSRALFHDAINGRQAQTGAAPGIFGCEERFKDMGHRSLILPFPRIPHFHKNLLSSQHTSTRL